MKLDRIDRNKTVEKGDAYSIGRGNIPDGVLIEVEPVEVSILWNRCEGTGKYQMKIGGAWLYCQTCGGDGSVYESVVIVEDTDELVQERIMAQQLEETK